MKKLLHYLLQYQQPSSCMLNMIQLPFHNFQNWGFTILVVTV